MIGFVAALALFIPAAARPAGPPAAVEIRIHPTLEAATAGAGGPVLLVFFSTDCATCYDDLFEARFLVDKGGFPVSVVGVYCGPKDTLRAFLEKFAWTLPVVLDRKRILFRRFGVDMIPYKALLAGGREVYRDDPYKDYGRRREDLRTCLTKIFFR
jgi:hypothetical protein